MFFGIQLQDILPAAGILIFSEFNAFFKRKKRNENLSIIGDTSSDVLLFDANNKKPFEMILYVLGGFCILSSFLMGTEFNDFRGIVSTFSLGMTLIYLPKNIRDSNKVIVSKNGLVNQAFALKWEDLLKYEWDKDIKQQNWGVKFFKKGISCPSKLYVKRKLKPEFEEILHKYYREYLDTNFESEKSN